MKYLEDLLNELGIRNYNGDPIHAMEAYLGIVDDPKLPCSIDDSDDASSKQQVLVLFSSLLMNVWNASADRIEDYDLRSIDAVRATTWLAGWQENEPNILQQLLTASSSDDKASSSSAFLRSLYKHVADLSNIQFLVYRMRKQNGTRDPHSTVTNVSKRLQELKEQNERFNALEKQYNKHCDTLERLLGDLYLSNNASQRKLIRRLLSGIWTHYINVSRGSGSRGGLMQENTQAAAIPLTLNLLKRLKLSDPNVCDHLRKTILVPLHAPDGIVLWRDQTPVLELYHRVLCQCMVGTLQSAESICETISELVKLLQKGNSSKQVLLLHEIDSFLELLAKEEMTTPSFVNELVGTIAKYASSDHSRVAERALLFFKNQTFERLWQLNHETTLIAFLPVLARQQSWNPTVRKMTYTVLKHLQEHDEKAFAETCNRLFASQTLPVQRAVQHTKPAEVAAPPPHRRRPPSIVMPPPVQRYSKGETPPLTVTGVAPWAFKQQQTVPQVKNLPINPNKTELTNGTNNDSKKTGLDYVISFMESIKPPPEETGVSSWSKIQMAETPTYLPNLKFHDLVFGQDLGSGAFGVVRYARLIDKTKTRSHWPEYAVKIVSTEKIRAMGYEASVQREIAVLRVLSHPGIARLVSSFRFHDGAYLVLEYASRGDLHTLLHAKGSLDVDSTRFVIGEVVAALSSIHQDGFVYGDLKPENIVITEPGHLKLCDFGACRPVSDRAKETIHAISKNLLKNLRDGDWKSQTHQMEGTSRDGGWDESDGDHEDMTEEPTQDLRIEGTTAYLPPEVVLGQFPGYSSDSWALGCVMYQCLTGRPPLLETDDEATRSRIVTFDMHGEAENMSEMDRLFADKHADGISSDARDMITSLLDRDPSKRPGMTQLASHVFFTTNVFELHQKPPMPLDAGIVSPKPNARWARRQMSSIWAPQPEAYDLLSLTKNDNSSSYGGSAEGPIEEGEEAPGFFSASGDESKHMAVHVPSRFLTSMDQT